jgi:hypothetical protein
VLEAKGKHRVLADAIDEQMILRSKQERGTDYAAVAAFNRVCDTALLRDKRQSSTLPSGRHIQIVAFTAAGFGALSSTIDKPTRVECDQLACFAERGLTDEEEADGQGLRKLSCDREFWAFSSTAIAARKNIVIADPAGSGNEVK